MFIYPNIIPSGKALPYVYQLVHKETGEFYIGFRYGNVKINRPATEDLPLYRTSSKKVNPKFDEFEWGIIAEFEDKDEAYTYEQKLIHENWGHPMMLNERCQHNGSLLQRDTPEIRKKQSEAKKGWKPSEEMRRAQSERMKGNSYLLLYKIV